jgi:hypothetical protein
MNNALTKSGNAIGDQTFTIGDTPLQLLPNYVISATVDKSICPLTFSFYVKDTNGNWVI